jgi:hypothetical protein
VIIAEGRQKQAEQNTPGIGVAGACLSGIARPSIVRTPSRLKFSSAMENTVASLLFIWR